MADLVIQQFVSGVHNLYDDENIPVDAYKNSLNWITNAGAIELAGGKTLIGSAGAVGDVPNEWFGYKTDGSKVHYRFTGGKFQYFDGTTWQDIITGLVATDEYNVQNYSSLAGSFTYFTGPGGIFKINNANPGSYMNMYSADTNFQAKCLIDKARMLAYYTANNKTTLYGSRIDAQNSTVYTKVTNEVVGTGTGAQTVFTGTLAFKGGNPLANCFGLSLNMNPSGITATDNYLGVISGTGVTGTINYITGAYSLTFSTPVALATQVRISYQWENSNNKGITDFTFSSPRVASEGFIIPQDEGGDPILKVLVGLDGSYYSAKKNSFYQLTIDATDSNPTNELYRKDIGIPYWQAAVSTGKGIVFMNTVNPDKPALTRLERNPLGGNIEPALLFTHFKWSNYNYDQCVLETVGEYILVSCKQPNSVANDRLIICNTTTNTVDITSYGMRSLAKDGSFLYGGSSLSQSTYQLLSGFDDDQNTVENFVELKGETFQSESLKKVRRIRLQGRISKDQSYAVYFSEDDVDYRLVGTVLGNGSYVDLDSPQTLGSDTLGSITFGGGSLTADDLVYKYYVEIKVKCTKFRKRSLRFVALGYGYCSITQTIDWDILKFEKRMPKRFRLKQNVSLDGASTDITPPQF